MTDDGGEAPALRGVHGDGPVRDDDVVAWLVDAGLDGVGSTVGRVVPAGFAAYARLLHPASDSTGRPVPWREIAAWSGHELRPTSDPHELLLRGDGQRWDQRAGRSEPMPGPGGLGPAGEQRLAELLGGATSASAGWFLVDEVQHRLEGDGSYRVLTASRWPPRRPWRDGLPWPTRAERERHARDRALRERYAVPLHRAHYLYPCRLDPGGGHPSDACYVWPADRAWVTHTDIDCPTTYVGGSAELVARLLDDDVVEAHPASIADPWDGHG